jgi:hypothetical protein
MILYVCVISMFIYACECIGLRNIVIMMYMYLTMLYGDSRNLPVINFTVDSV